MLGRSPTSPGLTPEVAVAGRHHWHVEIHHSQQDGVRADQCQRLGSVPH